MDPDVHLQNFERDLADLRLLHLADSALPIGGLAHSFGLESLVSQELLRVSDLPEFLRGFLEEAGMVEAVFCREAVRLVRIGEGKLCTDRWVELNDRLGALKPARESRAGSASLGNNFLAAAAALGDFAMLRETLEASKQAGISVHHSLAFGLASGVLGFAEDRAVLAYLHQSITSMVSACQRLLPLGQSAATRILWNLKPVILEMANRSATCAVDDVCCFMPLLDWGAMEHPALRTRLFVS
jgi:urease accessory protein